jgi:aspartyl-tRNA synthetase
VQVATSSGQALAEVLAAGLQQRGADRVRHAEDLAEDVDHALLAIEAEQQAGRATETRFLDDELLERWREPGHTLLFVADEERIVAKVLGLLRLQLGRELGLIDASRWEFRWIVDMAAAEYDEQTGTWHAAHHPFTRPTDDTVELLKADPSRARAVAYDLVGNGIELAGGSFRIHEPELQQQVFANLGIGPDEQREKFGFLLDALAMGAPPHGGIASGIDRLLMALLGEERIRDTQAFPKNQVGYDYMTGAPIELTEEQLDELGIDVNAEVKAEAGRS